MKKLSTLLYFLLLAGLLQAQTFSSAKTLIEHESANTNLRLIESIVDPSGNEYVLGTFLQADRQDIDFAPGILTTRAPYPTGNTPDGVIALFLAKYQSNGLLEWVRAGWSFADGLNGAAQGLSATDLILHDGDVYLSGNINSSLKFSTGFEVSGGKNASGNTRQGFIQGYDATGNSISEIILERTTGGETVIEGLGSFSGFANSIYIAGHYKGSPYGLPVSNSYSNAFAGRLRPSDGLDQDQLAIARNSSANSYAYDVYVDNNQVMHVAGVFSGITDFDASSGIQNISAHGGIDVFLTRYDVAQNFISAVSSGSAAYEQYTGMRADENTGLGVLYYSDIDGHSKIIYEVLGDNLQSASFLSLNFDENPKKAIDFTIDTNGDIYYIGTGNGTHLGRESTNGDFMIEITDGTFYYTITQINIKNELIELMGFQGIGTTPILDLDFSSSGESLKTPGIFQSNYSIDSDAPVITGSTPSDNQTGVNINLNSIEINFDEDIYYQEGHGTTTIALRKSGDPTPVKTYDITNFSTRNNLLNSAPNQLRLFGLPPLEYSTNYYVEFTYTGDVPLTDWIGQPIAVFDNTTLNFSTEATPDLQAPIITDRVPANGETGINIGIGQLQFTTDELLLLDESPTFNYEILDRDNSLALVHTIVPTDINIDGNQVIISNIPLLDPLTDYSVNLKDNGPVTDLSGNPVSSFHTNWQFQTGPTESVAPTVTSVIPAFDSEDVPYNIGSLTMTFSEPIVPRPSGATTFYLRRVGPNTQIQQFELGQNMIVDGNTVILSDVPDLTPGVNYWVQTELAFNDLAGNFWVPFTDGDWDFTVRSGADITSLSPAHESTGVSTSTDLIVQYDEPVRFQENITQAVLVRRNGSIFRIYGPDSPELVINGSQLFIDLPELTANTDFSVEIRYTLENENGEGIATVPQSNWTFTTGNSNSIPSNISLSNTSISESNNINDVIGTFSTTDSDGMDTHTYSLVSGGADNNNFIISGNQLLAAIVFDSESQSNHEIRVRTTDSQNGSFEKDFQIQVVAPPTLTSVSPVDNSTIIPLNQTFTATFDKDIVLESGQNIVKLFRNGVEWSNWSEGNNNLSVNNNELIFTIPGLENEIDYSLQLLNIQGIDGGEISPTDQEDWSFTTISGDVTPPSYISIDPADEATNVPVNQRFTITFDEDIQAPTDTYTGFLSFRRQSNDEAIWNIPYSTESVNNGWLTVTNNSISFSRGLLPTGTACYVSIADNIVKDLNGNAVTNLDNGSFWRFTTDTPPAITSLSPADNSTDVPLSQTFTAEFDENIVLEEGDLVIRLYRFGALWSEFLEGNTNISVNDNTLTFTLPGLENSTDYSLQLLNVNDEAGNELAITNQADWSFSTIAADNQSPLANSTSPSDEGIFAPLNGSGGIVFNEAIEQGSGTIELYLGNGTLVETITTGVNDARLGQPADFRITWDFDTDLIPSTEYYILVSAGAYQDLAGNPFAGFSEGDLNFTSNARPLIENLIPSNNATEVGLNASLTLDLDVNVYVDGDVQLVIKKTASDETVESIDLGALDMGVGPGEFPDGIITVDPASDFEENIGYYVVLEGTGSLISSVNVEAFVGLDDKNDWNFTTSLEKQDQTITFNEISDKTFGYAPFELQATASSGLPVSYEVISGPASVAGNTLTISGAGEVIIEATQDGDDDFNAATPIQRTLTVNKAEQTIDFEEIPDQLLSSGSVELSVTASSGLDVSFTLDQGDGTLSGNTLTFNSTGTYTVTANQAGNDNYESAAATQNFIVTDDSKQDQIISFETITDKTFGDASFELSATSDSGLPVLFSSSDPDILSVDGTTATIEGAGEVTIFANQTGNDTFNPAAEVAQMITIKKADQTITFDALVERTYGDASFDLDAVSTSGLEIAYESSNTSVATVSGSTISIVGAGNTTIIASQAGDNNYNAAATVIQELKVAKATQTINFEEIGDQDINTGSVNLVASSSSELAIEFVLEQGDGSISGTSLTFNSTGTFTVNAIQAGNENYLEANARQTFVVTDATKQNQTITFDAINTATYGDLIQAAATSSSGLAVSFSILSGPASINDGEIKFSGIGTVIIQASQTGNMDFNPAPPVEQSFEVLPAILEVAAEDKNVVYNEDIPELTYSITGFVYDEDENELTGMPVASSTAGAGDDAGTYEISVSGGEAANYTFTFTNGTLTIEKAQATITLTNLEQEADGTAKEVSVSTDPAGLNYMITYDGSSEVPVEAGEYVVEVVIDEINYQGSITEAFIITGEEDVLNVSEELNLRMFPNPVVDLLTISGVHMKSVQLYNLEGKLIQFEYDKKLIEWNLSSQKEGVYLIKIITSDDKEMIKRIIKR